MLTLHTHTLAGAALLLAPAAAQQLMIPEATGDQVMLFDATDGELLDPSFIDLTTSIGQPPIAPTEALLAPNGEIWITDQVADTVFRFSGDGTTSLGQSNVPLNNIRGFEITQGHAWVTNANPNGSTPGRTLVQLDLNLQFVAAHPVPGSPFDALAFEWQGVQGILVTDFVNHDLVFFDPAQPANLTTFHDSDGVTGIQYPEFLSEKPSDGNVLAGGLIFPTGIFEYDRLTGAEVSYIANPGGQSGIRSAYELGDGRILFTNMAGVHRYDPATGQATTLVAGVDARAISALALPTIGQTYCAGVPNSTGAPAQATASGSVLVALDDVTLACADMPTNSAAFFLTSTTQDLVVGPSGSQGNLCLGGAIGRFVGPGQVLNSGAAGSVSLVLDLAQQPTPTGFVVVQPGETWSFQCWYRDAVGGVATSNLSSALAVAFQ